MKKRIIAVIAAVAMIYGSALISQAHEGEPVKGAKDDREASIDSTGDEVNVGTTEIAEVTVADAEQDGPVNIGYPEYPGADKGAEVDDVSRDSEPVPEGEDFNGIITNEGPIYVEAETAVEEPVDEYEPEPTADGDIIEQVEEPEQEPVEESPTDQSMEYIGDWTATGYCPAECCCGSWAWGATASGVMPTANHTVACNSLPFGTQLMIDGIVYTVEDTGWSPYGDAWVDIFFDTHSEALAWGERIVSVYLVR